jgi:diguanylate cyclase (GGDEF)-like protein
MLAVFSVTLMGEVLTPTGRMLSSAELAMILVGVGLFLPWPQRWHIAALSSAGGFAIAFVLSPIGAALGVTDQVKLIVAVVMASTVSMVGHGLSQGRARTMLEQQFTLRRLSRYARLQETNVTELNRELNVVARRDSLTGIGNRLALDEAIVRLLEQGSRIRPLPFALILFDLDHFKAYNDEHGHQAGDAALGRTGDILRRATRGTDVAFRYGGEEFLLLIPDTDLTGAIAVAERVRVATEEPSDLPPFTISGGVALWDPIDGRDPQPLLRRADTALYLAKRAGRNRILADELSVAMQRQKIASA